VDDIEDVNFVKTFVTGHYLRRSEAGACVIVVIGGEATACVLSVVGDNSVIVKVLVRHYIFMDSGK